MRGGLPVVFAALVLATPASATPGSTSFKITGYEYAFTSTVGSFAGRGTGNTGDTGFWNATVNHDRLGARSAFVNGGTFVITVKKATGGLDAVAGTFVHHGGTIATLKPGANCTNQQYRVTAKLQDVLTPSSSGGSGMLSATLTHYRLRALGRCIAYKARVAGAAPGEGANGRREGILVTADLEARRRRHRGCRPGEQECCDPDCESTAHEIPPTGFEPVLPP